MLLRLYDEKPKKKPWERRPKRELLLYKPTAETRQWVAELEAINAFTSAHDIGLPVSTEERQQWLDHLNTERGRSGAPYRAPELIQTDLYRVFNNGSFGQGGRMYGGWWQNVPRTLRPLITIDGQPTVELDFRGCHINMLYNERAWECDGDAYELPEISEYEAKLGLKPGHYRSCIKQYTQALINARKGGRPSRIQLKDGTDFPEAFQPIEIVRMIECRHKAIKSAFRSNTGLRLQRLDSDIAVEVVLTAMSDGWLTLPVHDSFIATVDNEERLRSLMKYAYVSRFGYDIQIKNNDGC